MFNERRRTATDEVIPQDLTSSPRERQLAHRAGPEHSSRSVRAKQALKRFCGRVYTPLSTTIIHIASPSNLIIFYIKIRFPRRRRHRHHVA
jgi:hypothetical protein